MTIEYDSDEPTTLLIAYAHAQGDVPLTTLLIAYAHAQGDVPEGITPRVEWSEDGAVLEWSTVDLGAGWGA